MESIIIICLMVVILLLVADQFRFTISRKDKESEKDTKEYQHDVIGATKSKSHLSVDSEDEKIFNDHIPTASVDEPDTMNSDHLIENDDIRDLDESRWIDEEEEFQRYALSNTDRGLAQGVTFEELGAVDVLLKNETTDQNRKEKVSNILRRLQGTELFDLLENSMQDASQKMRALLENTFSDHLPNSTDQDQAVKDFDIGDFI